MLRFVLLAMPAGYAQLAYAIAFPGPAPTAVYAGLADMIRARAPEPTLGPALAVRATNWTATCGFDEWGDAVTCDSGYSCVFYSAPRGTAGMAGCVSSDEYEYADFARSCIDYRAISVESECGPACWQNSFIVRCTDRASPYCQSSTYIDANAVDYDCDTDGASTYHPLTSSTVSTLSGGALSTIVLRNQVVSGDVVTGWEDLSSSVEGGGGSTASDNAAAGKGDSTSSAPPSSSSSSTPTPPPSGQGSSSNAGAIAGGVVGGVVGLAIVAAAVFFLLRRQKQKARAAAAAAAPPDYAHGSTHYADKLPLELGATGERVEADAGTVIYKKEAPGMEAGSPHEMNSLLSPQEAPSPPQVHEIGSSGK